MKTYNISESELLIRTKVAAKNEKVATLELLRYLVQVDERRAYTTLACHSLFEYVEKVLGYSQTQTSERVNSVRLMRAVPTVEKKIETGELSMTTASQVQRFLRQEKDAGNKLSHIESLKVIETCLGQSKREVEKTLFSLSSQEARIASSEKVKELSEDCTELKFTIDETVFQKLSEVKNLIGNDSLKCIFDQALDALLIQVKKKKGIATQPTQNRSTEATDSKKESTLQAPINSAKVPELNSARSRFISIHTKREISLRSGGQCEFVDRKTGVRCTSRYRLELDHYPIPFSMGGKNDANSLRHACFQHNQKFAMECGLLQRVNVQTEVLARQPAHSREN